MLSNGNPIETKDLDNGKHMVVWRDPFKKPCYLFAVVAGDLASLHDIFTTKSGRKVQLGIYVEHGYEDQASFALESLKKAMKWDEDVYEEYIRAAKDELYEYCKAVFEHPRFKRIVLDVSGGFDSRLSFATANNLPKKLRKKMYTFTRKSGTGDDVEKASAITNMYEYPKHTYAGADTSALYDADGKINLAHVSRNLGTYAVCSYLYSSEYYDEETIELTGYLGEVIAGFKRCRGELDYSLGDKRLLARLGGSYWWNSVEELQEVFRDRDRIIDGTLERYPCDCLFKKFHMLYLDFRNRFICNSSHNVENNNMRIPMLFSKNALKAKWMYFDLFTGNAIPDEKISIDLLNAINPLLACLPFASDTSLGFYV